MSKGLGSCGLTVLRLVVGIIFLVHGWQKVFSIGLHGVAGMFGQMHIPFPLVSAAVVMAVEFLGGIALVFGLATRWAALLLAIDMVGAIFFVHGRNGFYMSHFGYEYVLALLGACVCLALSGPGALALGKRN